MSNHSWQDEKTAIAECLDDRDFGHILRRSRLRQGLSLRAVAKSIGLSAHSGVAEYESGRRLPPEDLIASYERVLGLPPGYLLDLRRQVLHKRADRMVARSQVTARNPGLPSPVVQPSSLSVVQPSSMLGRQHHLAVGVTIIGLIAGVMLVMTKLRRTAGLANACRS